jgi:hypothetical protein
VQPPLRLPSDGVDLRLQSALPLLQPAAEPGFVLVGPGGFDNQPAQMRVAGLGNPSLKSAILCRNGSGAIKPATIASTVMRIGS